MSKMENESGIDVRLLELLACPLTKGPLVWDAARGELVSRVARLAYPVREGIPVMLPSEARQVDPDAAGQNAPKNPRGCCRVDRTIGRFAFGQTEAPH
jgi:uncharacterized protein YbaR (Trm112 family)